MGTLTAAERAPFIAGADIASHGAPDVAPVAKVKRGDGTGPLLALACLGAIVGACIVWPHIMLALACVGGILAMIGLAKVR